MINKSFFFGLPLFALDSIEGSSVLSQGQWLYCLFCINKKSTIEQIKHIAKPYKSIELNKMLLYAFFYVYWNY